MLLYRIRDAVKGFPGKSISAKEQKPGKAAALSVVCFVSVFATFEGTARSMVTETGPMPKNRGETAL